MARILVVDDMAIFRDPIAASLRAAGFEAITACNGAEALTIARHSQPDLVLLDVGMPVMDGMTFLAHLREDTALRDTRVILLTAAAERKHVLTAASLGVKDYLLKTSFTLKDLVDRVQKNLSSANPSESSPAAPGPCAATPAETKGKPEAIDAPNAKAQQNAVNRSSDVDLADAPRLLTRQACLQRAELAMQGKIFSGAALQAVALASSPEVDVEELAKVIAADPALSAKVLRAANSAAVGARRTFLTVRDAVSHVGAATTRNVCASAGIFERINDPGIDGFSPARCWRHSLCVATLCERLGAHAQGVDGHALYLMGLCHDLGELMFRVRFAAEYRQVLQRHKHSDKPLEQLERVMLGISHADLLQAILESAKLPDAVRIPIIAHHDPLGRTQGRSYDRLAKLLRIADAYANGLFLASSPLAPICSITRATFRHLVGVDDPPALDKQDMRQKIVAAMEVLSQGTSDNQSDELDPKQYELRVWLARDPAFSSFDPLQSALESMTVVNLQDRLPTPSEVAALDALVVVGRTQAAAGFSVMELERLQQRSGTASIPVLHLVARDQEQPSGSNGTGIQLFPLPLQRLSDFVELAARQASARRLPLAG